MATVDTVRAVAALVEAAAHGAATGGATRHVVASAVASAIRTALSCCLEHDNSETEVEALVSDRLEALRPVLRAQSVASRLAGVNLHSAHGLVSDEALLRANAARHSAFEPGAPVSDLSVPELKRRQRGGRRRYRGAEAGATVPGTARQDAATLPSLRARLRR